MTDEREVRYAGFLVRAIANLVDSICVGLIVFPFLFVVNRLVSNSPGGTWFSGIPDIVGMAVVIYNSVYLVGKTGQSWGRELRNIKVVGYDGNPIGFVRSMLRCFIAATLSTFIFGLGFLWVIWDSKKQAWHDKILKTYVVRVG